MRGGGPANAFVTKLDPRGSVVYSTLLGGNGDDEATGVALEPDCPFNCNAYVVGSTHSTTFPTTPNVVWPSASPGSNGFATKLNATGSDLLYSTYSNSNEVWAGIAVDGLGNAFVAGTVNGPLPDGGCNVRFAAGPLGMQDAFVGKLRPDASALDYCAVFGGSRDDRANSIAVDDIGDAYVTGTSNIPSTGDNDFPTTPDALRPVGNKGYAAKVSDDTSVGTPRMQFSAATYTVPKDGVNAVITVTRAGSTDLAVGVDYATSDGTAMAPDDYATTSGTLSFDSGETALAFTVPVVNRPGPQGDKTVNLALSNPTGGAILGLRSTAVLTITDGTGGSLSKTFRVSDRVLPRGPNWTATVDVPWLTVDGQSMTSGTGPSTVTATVDPTGLSPGTYPGITTVTGDTGDSPQFVNVTLTIS